MNRDTCVSKEVPAPVLADTRKRARQVDPAVTPWNIPRVLLDEFEATVVLHQGVRVLRRQRHEGVGPRFTKLNGCTVRYKLTDLQPWPTNQPTGGGAVPAKGRKRGPGRPRRTA